MAKPNTKDQKKKSKKKPKRKPVHRIAMISTHGYVAAEPPLGAPDTGGQVVYVLELAKKFAQFGYQVDIWTRQFETQKQEEYVDEGVRILRSPCGGSGFIPKEYLSEKIPQWSRNTLEYIKEKKLEYDFINSHYWDAGIAGELLKNSLSIPHIHTPHSLGMWKKEQMETDYQDEDVDLESKYNFTSRIKNEKSIFNSCDMVIATTPIQFDKIARDYGVPEKRIRMIPPGYDDNRFFPMGEPSRMAARERLGIENNTVFVMSRLALNKGVDLMIHGFSVLAERREDVDLLLAIGHDDRNSGEEELYQELLTLRKEYGLEDRIRFTGFIPDEDLPDYYRAADLFVLSSRYEPFGMTVIEAMACGDPDCCVHPRRTLPCPRLWSPYPLRRSFRQGRPRYHHHESF